MRVALAEKLNGIESVELGELSDPAPAAGQALIRVHGAGVGPWDVGFLSGGFPGIALPFVPGQEVGIDLDRRRSVIVRMDDAGEVLAVTKIDNDPLALSMAIAEAARARRWRWRLVMAGIWAADLLQAEGARVHLVHPLGLRWVGPIEHRFCCRGPGESEALVWAYPGPFRTKALAFLGVSAFPA